MKSKKWTSVVVMTLFAALAIPVRLAAQEFTSIDPPGSTFTQATGINPQGDIVGTYFDSSGNAHGFLLSKGTFTTIDVPGSPGTNANGINPRCTLWGLTVTTWAAASMVFC